MECAADSIGIRRQPAIGPAGTNRKITCSKYTADNGKKTLYFFFDERMRSGGGGVLHATEEENIIQINIMIF